MSAKVNADVTRKIAQLSRLKLNPEEIEQYTKELGKILDFVAALNEVDTSGVEPIVHGVELGAKFRADKAIALSEEATKAIVACSEQMLYDQYKVPQVIGGE